MSTHLVIGLIALSVLFAFVLFATVHYGRIARTRRAGSTRRTSDDGAALASAYIASIDAGSAASVDCASSVSHC